MPLVSNGVNMTSKRFTIFVLMSLLFFQLIYSFLFPSVGFNDSWQPISAYLPKFEVESQDVALLSKFLPFVSSEYRLNSDVGEYLVLARNFDPLFFENHPYLNRPLYPGLILFASMPLWILGTPSYGVIFGSAILLNFILAAATVLLFFSLLKKYFSGKVSFFSSVLLIFSPFFHTFLVQPVPHILSALAVVASLCLLENYFRKPSLPKLIIFSLLVGVFMLGKMFYAIPIFILLLAVFSRRFKEGIIFFLVHLIPVLLWYLWVTRVWQIPYYSLEVQNFQMGIWFFSMFSWPWAETYRVLLAVFPRFITSLIYSFLLIPIIFSLIGYKKLPFKRINLFYFGSLFSVFLFCFIANFYLNRFLFLLFPIIYPTAVLGIERVADYLKKHKSWYSPVFYAIVIGLIIFISNINIFQVFDYLDYN